MAFKKCVVTAPRGVTLNTGTVLRLTKQQHADRRHALEDGKGKNVYVVVTSVMFKNGEEIEIQGDVNKALLSEFDAPGAKAPADSTPEEAPKPPSVLGGIANALGLGKPVEDEPVSDGGNGDVDGGAENAPTVPSAPSLEEPKE